MKLKTIEGVSIRNKHVLLRVDFNVFVEGTKIADDFRIRRSLRTIRHLLKEKAKIIIITHFGRPLHIKDRTDMTRFSLREIAKQLEKDMGHKVKFVGDCIGSKAKKASLELKAGEILMLENLRFHKEEEGNDPVFASKLAALADIYVNDAFSVCHRAHASVSAITKFLPAYAGFLLAEEVKVLHSVYVKPKLPLVIAIGGMKIDTKAKLIKRFFNKVSSIMLGGAIANFVLKVKGIAIGKSRLDDASSEELRDLDWTSSKLHLPLDVVVSREISPTAWVKTVGVGNVQDNEIILDIGPETVDLFSSIVASAGTIIWNGPLGFTELPAFAVGTTKFAQALASSKAFTVVGGGDSVVLIDTLKLYDKINFVSTGGGAMLEFLSGEPMPGIDALVTAQKTKKKTKPESRSIIKKKPIHKKKR